MAQRRGGQAPALREEKSLPHTVGRGPVPRHATIAGDRPPRYGGQDAYHRARTRPAHLPCSSGSPDPEPFYRPPTGEPELQWARCLPVGEPPT